MAKIAYLVALVVIAPALAAEPLLINRGLYVLDGSECAAPSSMSTYRYDGEHLVIDGIACAFTKVEELTGGSRRLVLACSDEDSGSVADLTVVLKIVDEGHLTIRNEDSPEQLRLRYCPGK